MLKKTEGKDFNIDISGKNPESSYWEQTNKKSGLCLFIKTETFVVYLVEVTSVLHGKTLEDASVWDKIFPREKNSGFVPMYVQLLRPEYE